MITLKLTQKQTELIIHSLGSEAIRLNDNDFMTLRNNVSEQISKSFNRSKRVNIVKSVNIVNSFLTQKK